VLPVFFVKSSLSKLKKELTAWQQFVFKRGLLNPAPITCSYNPFVNQDFFTAHAFFI